MLNLLEFKRLDENEQAEAAFGGIYLDERKENDQVVQLYRVNDFYVEVFYDQQANQLTEIKPFAHKSGLVPYLGGF